MFLPHNFHIIETKGGTNKAIYFKLSSEKLLKPELI